MLIKTKHTGSTKLAGILRRIAKLHSMVVLDPRATRKKRKAKKKNKKKKRRGLGIGAALDDDEDDDDDFILEEEGVGKKRKDDDDMADAPSSFRGESDFHRAAQGRCFDVLLTRAGPRSAWMDKALSGRGGKDRGKWGGPGGHGGHDAESSAPCLKVASVREPTRRALSALRHSRECGKGCAMCWKLVKEPLRWARQCGEVHNSQALQLQGDATSFGRVAVAGVGATLAAGGRVQQRLPGGSGGGSAAREAAEAALFVVPMEEVVEDYDLVVVAERYWESLVILRHVLGVALSEVLFLASSDGKILGEPPAASDGQPGGGGSSSGGGGGDGSHEEPLLVDAIAELQGGDGSGAMTADTQRFLEVLRERNAFDIALYDAANAALDEKVAVFGPEVVAAEAAELRAMQQLVQQACGDTANAADVLSISNTKSNSNSNSNGGGDEIGIAEKRRYSPWDDCLWKDQGCGHQCIVRWASMYEAAAARSRIAG